jgi:steroid delta-isomerase-like uncharacterized protein
MYPDSPAATAEAVVRRLIEEGFSQGRLAVADELIAPDVIEHQSFGPEHPAGPEGVKRVIASLRRAFPDFRLEIAELAVQGDLVWIRNVATGTNDGSYTGYPATGRSMRIDVFDLLRVRDGKIVEHWGSPDRLGALHQLGLVRPPVARTAAA